MGLVSSRLKVKIRRFARVLTSSLSARVVILSTIWNIIIFFALSIISLWFYWQASEKNLERILKTQLYSLISAVSVTSDGRLQGAPDLGDIRYSDPDSGWYWEVTALSGHLRGHLTSDSLRNKRLRAPSEAQSPFNEKFSRAYRLHAYGQFLQVIEIDVALGKQNRVARFRIIGNIDEARREAEKYKERLEHVLFIFALISIFLNIGIILFSLRPLKRIRQTLNDIRVGRASHVTHDLSIEVMPLVREMNGLIDNNRRIVERYRTQVGNLAHSLKTPLSVVANAIETLKGEQASLLKEQIQIMQAQINHYLQRAQIAAQRDSVIYHSEVQPAVEQLLRVLRKLYLDKNFTLEAPKELLIFAGEKEDLQEIVGNLVENAAKWSTTKVVVRCHNLVMPDGAQLQISIEDDGPGLDEVQSQHALKRGKRLDESKPGSGLGLSIVVDLVREYGGTIMFSKSSFGGLCVQIIFPIHL